ncbi:hypothetical protein E3N88_38584 [Mikania micrantha]|uniref:Uncharacterized protein n=1 Tax=Mikania micrantha TaxID=192012 RepID=A0A5N6LUG6_9ASTR|nr:hypothetical protein E3N88_38584 [Mikania micrantha]
MSKTFIKHLLYQATLLSLAKKALSQLGACPVMTWLTLAGIQPDKNVDLREPRKQITVLLLRSSVASGYNSNSGASTISTRRRDGEEAESLFSDHMTPRVSVQPASIVTPVIPYSSGVMATSTLTFPYDMSSPLLPPYYPQTPFIPPFNHMPSQTSVLSTPSGSFVSSGPNPAQGTISMITNPLTLGGGYGTIPMTPYAS